MVYPCAQPVPSFNSRPVWGERALIPLEQRYKWLQLTSPVRGRTQKFVCQKSEVTNYNSRPREGANFCLGAADNAYCASTHAPVWGRTYAKDFDGLSDELQLTPREGGECRAMANVSKLDNSNSLHSVGKPQRLPPGYDCNETTTHAP